MSPCGSDDARSEVIEHLVHHVKKSEALDPLGQALSANTTTAISLPSEEEAVRDEVSLPPKKKAAAGKLRKGLSKVRENKCGLLTKAVYFAIEHC